MPLVFRATGRRSRGDASGPRRGAPVAHLHEVAAEEPTSHMDLTVVVLEHSHRFGTEVLRSKTNLDRELRQIVARVATDLGQASRPDLTRRMTEAFTGRKWESQVSPFPSVPAPGLRLDFLKKRVAVELAFGHGGFAGSSLLKLEAASFRRAGIIDVGVMVATTKGFQEAARLSYGNDWRGSLEFEQLVRYLQCMDGIVRVPVCVLGMHVAGQSPEEP